MNAGDFLSPVSMNAHVLKVFNGEYSIRLNIKEPIILDIGACIGAFTYWASYMWEGCTIYAYEPIKYNFELLKKNTRDIKNLTLFNVAVRDLGVDSGTMMLGDHNCGCASFHNTGDQLVNQTEEVVIVNPNTLPKSDIIKIDTEGCELEILEGLDLSQTKAIMLETHRKEDAKKIRDFLTEFELIELRNPYLERWGMKFLRR